MNYFLIGLLRFFSCCRSRKSDLSGNQSSTTEGICYCALRPKSKPYLRSKIMRASSFEHYPPIYLGWGMAFWNYSQPIVWFHVFQVGFCCFQRISWLTYIFQANFFLSKQIWYFLRIAVTLQHFLFPVGFPISNSLWSILPVSANHWFPLVSLHGSCNTNNCKKKQ